MSNPSPQVIAMQIHQDSSFCFQPSQWNNVAVLAANTLANIPIPKGAKRVIFSGANGVDFWVNFFGPAAIPGSNVTDGSGSELNPEVRGLDFPQVQSISVVAASATFVTLSFFK